MVNNDYRTMFNKVIGPILNFCGFYINLSSGVVQQNGTNIGISISGKTLYVPENGYDQFAVKDSHLVVAFNPFKILEHTLILSKLLCDVLSDRFIDDDDDVELNSAGEQIKIVGLIKRGPKNEDMVLATFTGVIYEIWCRNEEVLGKGIDEGGNDIVAIIMAMYDVISKHSTLVDPVPNFPKIFRYVARVESIREEELTDAKLQYSKNLAQIDLSEPVTMDLAEINDISSDDEKEIDNSSYDYNEPDNIYDDIEF